MVDDMLMWQLYKSIYNYVMGLVDFVAFFIISVIMKGCWVGNFIACIGSNNN